MILILIPVKSSFHDIIDSSKSWPPLVIFSDVLRYQTKMENPGSNGIWCIIKFLRGHLFFFDEWYTISLDSVCILVYCLYIWLYVHPIQFIGHPYQLVVWLVVCNPTKPHGLPGCHDLVALSVDSACESSGANEIYHWLGGGIIWLTSLKIMFLVWAMKFWAPGFLLGICWGWNMWYPAMWGL